MKKILPLILLFACSNKEKVETPPPPTVANEKVKKIFYEGTIKSKYGEGPIELALAEIETGLSSSFELKGDIMKDKLFGMATGEYSTLSGAASNEVILQLHGRFFMMGRAQKAPKKEAVEFKPELNELDLFFVTEGGNKLVLVDEDFDRIAEDNRFTLYKRSRLFTAEGYITFEDTRTEFFEQNTNERWNVAPLGVYGDAQHIYDSLVSQKFEGMYMKALAYSVESDSSDKELLVIKKILDMKKSEAYTNKERAAGLGYK
ncbi:MAG TPA: hypothetical protein VFU05_12025 [Cyclobacteriaceae bacterium]|nr:hypothetical protein [Cyclobacteriaceae bacterium]